MWFFRAVCKHQISDVIEPALVIIEFRSTDLFDAISGLDVDMVELARLVDSVTLEVSPSLLLLMKLN